jgi:RHS repeat-associated protein
VGTYAYDDSGRLSSAADAAGTVAYGYDAQDRVKTYSNVWGQVLTYSYDAQGRQAERDDWAGGVLTSTYDSAGRLSTLSFGGTGQTPLRIDFGYDNRDQLTGLWRYSDLGASTLVARTSYALDDGGRLTGLVTRNSASSVLSSYAYGYDAADRVTSEAWTSNAATGTVSGTRTFGYDAADQLTADGSSSYAYDSAGNRTSAGTYTYTTGADNRLTSDGTWTYGYDAEGNVTTKSKGSGLEAWYYGYDNANRLVSMRQTSDGVTTQVLLTETYDVENHRVQEQRSVSGGSVTTQRFASDLDGNAIADLDGTNAVTARRLFVPGTDTPLARTVSGGGTGSGLSFYVTDWLGSVRDVIDSGGVVRNHLDFTGFGVRTESDAAWGDRYGFTGREYQQDAGLQLNGLRWYNPSTGRWFSQDPIGFGGGDGNLYRYVGNDVTNATDPSGLRPIARNVEYAPTMNEWDAILKNVEEQLREKKVDKAEIALRMAVLKGILKTNAEFASGKYLREDPAHWEKINGRDSIKPKVAAIDAYKKYAENQTFQTYIGCASYCRMLILKGHANVADADQQDAWNKEWRKYDGPNSMPGAGTKRYWKKSDAESDKVKDEDGSFRYYTGNLLPGDVIFFRNDLNTAANITAARAKATAELRAQKRYTEEQIRDWVQREVGAGEQGSHVFYLGRFKDSRGELKAMVVEQYGGGAGKHKIYTLDQYRTHMGTDYRTIKIAMAKAKVFAGTYMGSEWLLERIPITTKLSPIVTPAK